MSPSISPLQWQYSSSCSNKTNHSGQCLSPPPPSPLQGGVGSNKGFVEVLAASQSAQNKNWFQGTADAVRQYMWLFEEAMREGCEDFLILSGEARGAA